MPSVAEPAAKSPVPPLSRRASLDLDLARGVAAIMVVLSHWRGFLFKDFGELSHHSAVTRVFYFLTGFGHQAVLVFFILSGFLVGGSVVRSVRADRWSWSKYLIDRGSRLYTVLLPALLFGLLLDWSGQRIFGVIGPYAATPQYYTLLKWPVAESLTLSAFLGNLCFLQTIHSPVFGSNGPLWSLANEFWYYLAFPLAWIGFFGRQRSWTRVAYPVAAAGILVFVGGTIAGLFVAWLMGAALSMRALPAVLSRRGARIIAFVVWLGVLSLDRLEILSHAYGRLHLPTSLATDLTLGAATAIWMATLIAQPDGEAPKLRAWFSTNLSHVSYTCYLVHFPAIVWLTTLLVRGGDRWDVSGSALLKAALVLAVVGVYVVAIWWMFERRTTIVREQVRRVFGRSPRRASHPVGTPGDSFALQPDKDTQESSRAR